MQKHRLLEQALPSLFPFSLPPPPPLFAPATQAIFDGLGALLGAYKIAIDEQAQPVVHTPR